MKTPVLETERLILRPIALDDAPAIQKYFNNWNIIGKLASVVPWPYPEDGAEIFIRENCLPGMDSETSFVWVIIPKSGPDEAIGVIDFRIHEKGDLANRGFWLAESFHGQGYMTEAVIAVNDFIFFQLGIEKFIVANAKGNIQSRRIKKKTAARLIGTRMVPHNNGDNETEIWEMTKENWKKFRNA
jgi:[ribosomal protein S5]-alanine N-acetyltransferase